MRGRFNKKYLFPLLPLALILCGQLLWSIDCRIRGPVSPPDRELLESLVAEAGETYLPMFSLEKNFQIHIHVCADLREFISLTRAGWWNGGHFRHPTIYLQRLSVLKERRILAQTITHEFLHYCIWRIAGRNCPLWLNEGLAANLSGEQKHLNCMEKPVTRELTPMEQAELNKHFTAPKREVVRKAYCKSASAVAFLLKTKGKTALLNHLREYK